MLQVGGRGHKMADVDMILAIALTASSICVHEQAWEKAEVDKKYEETSMYKRAQLRKIRSKLNDFQRFKVRVLKRQRNRTVNGGVVQLKKAMNKQ